MNALTQESFHKYNGEYDCPGKCSPELGMLVTMTDVSTTCAVVPGGGVLPYMTNTGMCRLTGCVFVLSYTGYTILRKPVPKHCISCLGQNNVS